MPMIDAPTYSIRIADFSDSDAVSALLVASYSILFAAHYSSEMLRSVLPHMTKANPKLLASRTYYVAEAEPGNLVGCGGWTQVRPGGGEIVEGEAHIRHFATHPDLVRRGVGGNLLARCFSDARHLSIRKLIVFSTLGGERFYEAFGFKRIGPIEVPMGQSLFPAILMSRELA
jgi:N-acetylglutamate synthase-like GNAT family acetyltransferase